MRSRVALILTVVGLLMSLAASPVAAAALTVNTISDGAPADDGSCTLREAITAANTDTASGATVGECIAGSGTDTISFTVSGTITVASALPAIASDVSINGAGAITVDGAGGFQVFHVNSGTVTLSGLTISGGSSGGNGGGVANDGTLTVADSTISGNTSFGGGGGILNNGILTVTDSTISGNSAIGGGGISNSGTATITDSVISENSAFGSAAGISNIVGTMTISNSLITDNTAAGGAGGIGNANGGTLTISNSTISDNLAEDGDGGGIANQPAGSSLTVTGSTISGNSASGAGGGIFYDTPTTATITNSTIAGNTAGDSGGGLAGTGSGTLVLTNATVTGNTATAGTSGGISALGVEILVNVIVAGNLSGGDPSSPDIEIIADVQSVTTSLVGVPAGKTLADIFVPAGLADNGGPTQTVALAQVTGNPAVDTATSSVCAAAPVNGVDQRGFPRPAACDMGAYEIQPTPAPSLPNAAVAGPATTGSWTALGFAVLLIGALGVLAVANLRVVRRRA